MQAEEAQDEEDEDDDVPAPRRQVDARPLASESAPTIEGTVDYGAVSYGEVAPVEPQATSAETAAEEAETAAWTKAPAEAVSEEAGSEGESSEPDEDVQPDLPPPETIGGENDTFEGNGADEARRRRAARFLRNYRIQEVIRRRQILLIQVVKEERGTKGAALTTYISLAGRYCVLMPNSPRGGGISRKITSAADRRRLKEITAELEIPKGMGLIVRTAGAARPKPEIRRDCEYLMRLWDDIRELTLRSMAPALIYEEASLIKRAIRDGYSRDIDEVMVDGEDGWKAAHDFMRMLMPSHAKKVQLWKPGANNGQPLFTRHQVDQQLDAMISPTVQLKSGGYLVINQAEALVAIDVNSGRSTRERGIEETALRTNLEAADEVARQLRLRDLAGLIVIDFIDMEAKKHNAMVERRMKDALKNDRARIQVGHISHFGLLEMSRQRLRPSLAETSFTTCPHCGGLGHVRSIESSAIHILRAIEDEAAKGRASLITLHAAGAVVLYLLNHKRERLFEIEARTGLRVHFSTDETLVPPAIRIERERPAIPLSERISQAVPTLPVATTVVDAVEDDEDADVVLTEETEVADGETEAEGGENAARGGDEGEKRRRRRRRRRGRREDGSIIPAGESDGEASGEAGDEGGDEDALPAEPNVADTLPVMADDEAGEAAAEPSVSADPSVPGEELDENGMPKARRRGRRGGRRRRRDDGTPGAAVEAEEDVVVVEPVYVAPVYTGPTPADPFGGRSFDIFDIMDQVERREEAKPVPAAPAPAVEEVPAPAPAAAEPEPVAVVVPEPIAAPAPEPVAAEPVVIAAPVVEATPPASVMAEPVVGPSIQPIVLGQDPAPAVPAKKGWWRR